MADVKISALPAAATPLAGTEVLPIVQGGTTDKVSVADLTAGRTVNAANFTASATVSGTTVSGTTVNVGAGTVSAPSISPTGDSNTGMFFPAADQIAFAEGGTEVMRIDASGNVGIGTSSPGYRLDVRDTANTTFHIRGNTSGVRAGTSVDTPVAGAGYVGTYSNHPLTLGINNAERARITVGGDFQFNSGYGSVATAFGCRAWVNFNGTGTVAIRASGNVSSITDNGGTGDYTVNFAAAMPDANYSVVCTSMRDSANSSNLSVFGSATYNTITTSNVRINNRDDSNNSVDCLAACVAIFR